MTHPPTTPEARVVHGLVILAAMLEAAEAEAARPLDEHRPETIHEIVRAARAMLAETTRLAAPLLEPASTPEVAALTIPLDERSRRLRGLKAVWLGWSVESLAASILRREAGAGWMKRRG